MKPLCKKDTSFFVLTVVVTLLEMFLYAMFWINVARDVMWFVIIIPLTIIIVYQIIEIIYWICQPSILIHQYDEGIVIKRNLKIEYKLIEKVYCKNYLVKQKRSNYYRTELIGTIYIKLKSGKLYKIKNVWRPRDAVDLLSKIKKQKKFR